LSSTRQAQRTSRTIAVAGLSLALAAAITCTSAASSQRAGSSRATRSWQARQTAAPAQPAAASLAIVLQPSGASQATLTAMVRHGRPRPHPHTPRAIARSLLPGFHWGHGQFRYLDWLWGEESGWNRFAFNPWSGAYGIPQASPGSVMASAGPGWQHNARTQIRWGMGYIRQRYGSPRQAWLHECTFGWY